MKFNDPNLVSIVDFLFLDDLQTITLELESGSALKDQITGKGVGELFPADRQWFAVLRDVLVREPPVLTNNHFLTGDLLIEQRL